MVIDPTISVGNLIQLGGMLIGGLAVLITLRNTVTGLKEDVTSIIRSVSNAIAFRWP